MANFHLRSQFFSRTDGHSAGEAAAYRIGGVVRDEQLLFSTKSKLLDDLRAGVISKRMRTQFEKHGIELSKNASIAKDQNRWVIRSGRKNYTIRYEMAGRKEPKPQFSFFENKSHDYRTKEGVIHTEIIAPEGAPDWAKDRDNLWNTAAFSDKRKTDAQVAHEVRLALPRELSLEQQKELTREFVQEQFVSKGMVADVAIHEVDASDGYRQPHAHILTTMREIDGDGFKKQKNRSWHDGRAGQRKQQLNRWRKAWADKQNEHLEKIGSEERVDHRSLKAQGFKRIPQFQMGKKSWNQEKRGVETKLGNDLRGIRQKNGVRSIVPNRVSAAPLKLQTPIQFLLARAFELSTGKTNPAHTKHHNALQTYFRKTLMRPVQVQGQFINRLSRTARTLLSQVTMFARRLFGRGVGYER